MKKYKAIVNGGYDNEKFDIIEHECETLEEFVEWAYLEEVANWENYKNFEEYWNNMMNDLEPEEQEEMPENILDFWEACIEGGDDDAFLETIYEDDKVVYRFVH